MIGNILGGAMGKVAAQGDYESIATATLSSGQNQIEFANISSAYQHLQIRGVVNSNSGAVDNIYMRFNSDSASNYSWHALSGNGTSASSAAGATDASMLICRVRGTGTNVSGFVLDILDYANTNKFKTIRSLSGFDENGSGELWFWSGVWRKSPIEAVSNIKISPSFGGATNMIANTRIALYGIKG